MKSLMKEAPFWVRSLVRSASANLQSWGGDTAYLRVMQSPVLLLAGGWATAQSCSAVRHRRAGKHTEQRTRADRKHPAFAEPFIGRQLAGLTARVCAAGGRSHRAGLRCLLAGSWQVYWHTAGGLSPRVCEAGDGPGGQAGAGQELDVAQVPRAEAAGPVVVVVVVVVGGWVGGWEGEGHTDGGREPGHQQWAAGRRCGDWRVPPPLLALSPSTAPPPAVLAGRPDPPFTHGRPHAPR